jgi:hypothetical protein
MDTETIRIAGLKLIDGTWRVRKVHQGRRIVMDTGTSNQVLAERIMKREIARIQSLHSPSEPGWDSFVCGPAGKAWISRAFNAHKQGSKKRDRDFTITRQDLHDIARRSRGRCEFSYLPFQWDGGSLVAGKRPWAPSFDRIDCRQGYVKGNIRLVLLIVNTGLMDWGDEVFLRLCWGVFLMHNGAALEHGQKLIDTFFNDIN